MPYPHPGEQGGDAVTKIRKLVLLVASCASLTSAALADEPRGHITGVGGIFFKSKDPKALMAWYRDVLGIKLEPWGGAALRYNAPEHPPVVTLNAFSLKTKYMDPSTGDFMIDFAVDDLSAFLDRLKAKGVTILSRDDSDPSGNFAWILDPDGNKIELWQAKPAAAK
jgi:predicted enzyme related to lactoylglutathione lyase